MNLTRRSVLAGLAAAAVAGCSSRPTVVHHPAASPPALGQDPSRMGADAVVDLSHLDQVIDFSAARWQSGILGVIHKASEGYDWVDPTYDARRAKAEAAGLLWGAYHFGTFEQPGEKQAAAFLAAAKPGPRTVLALDVELNERRPANSMDVVGAEAFVRAVYQVTGRLPLVYIHPSWADGLPVGGSRRTFGGAVEPGMMLAACDLWVADYRAEPRVPRAWAQRGWHLWQYAGDDNGQFPGRTRAVAGIAVCDRNVFRGGPSDLSAYWNRA